MADSMVYQLIYKTGIKKTLSENYLNFFLKYLNFLLIFILLNAISIFNAYNEAWLVGKGVILITRAQTRARV